MKFNDKELRIDILYVIKITCNKTLCKRDANKSCQRFFCSPLLFVGIIFLTFLTHKNYSHAYIHARVYKKMGVVFLVERGWWWWWWWDAGWLDGASSVQGGRAQRPEGKRPKHKTGSRLKQVIYSQWRAPLVCPKILISTKNEKTDQRYVLFTRNEFPPFFFSYIPSRWGLPPFFEGGEALRTFHRAALVVNFNSSP